jgi:hypothetical protein
MGAEDQDFCKDIYLEITIFSVDISARESCINIDWPW